ncbi:class I SAM-dependent methyltransferase [Nocardioides taihuensis]|uniref:Class I SAM-dependent methyltransferase n=1 Tax=Nocardioides taihuensis TaxID=1835606 RepID=A0ABW0BMD3_9ACTN
MPERGLSFGAVASAYERFRPGYPDALVDVVQDYSGRRIRTALEIGAGTGKATRLFAAHGVAVTATEPDPAMLEELRRHVPPSVRAVRSTFEEWPGGPTFDLAWAAASLHWTEPAGRWERVAGWLAPGGVFASFGGPVGLVDPAVEDAVRAARAPYLESDDVPSPDGTPPEQAMQWPGTELERSPWFDDVRQLVLERPLTMSASDYVGYLSTVSAYVQLPGADRQTVLDRILTALPTAVEVAADVVVHLARRGTSP